MRLIFTIDQCHLSDRIKVSEFPVDIVYAL
jgi:hypothetical protein